jgi:hypothetical protein
MRLRIAAAVDLVEVYEARILGDQEETLRKLGISLSQRPQLLALAHHLRPRGPGDAAVDGAERMNRGFRGLAYAAVNFSGAAGSVGGPERPRALNNCGASSCWCSLTPAVTSANHLPR